MNILKQIRIGFADAKAMITNIPKFFTDMKKDAESKVLHAKFHQMVDVIINTYGDTIVAVCKSIDLNVLQSITEDIALLAGKYQEPLEKQARAIGEALEPVMDKYVKQTERFSSNIHNIIQRMSKRNGWEKINLPSDELAKAEAKTQQAAKKARTKHHERAVGLVKARLSYLFSEEDYKLRNNSGLPYSEWLEKEGREIANRIPL